MGSGQSGEELSKIRISIPAEGFETTATLLDSEAPVTCDSLRKILPVDGSMLHAASSGNETLIELSGEKKVRIEPENWVFQFIPGDVLYWHSLWGDGKFLRGSRDNAEIVFIYGRNVVLRDLGLRATPANLFGHIDSGLDEFAAICKRLRLEGAKKLAIESVG
jgi:hypothetical protein